MYVLYLDASGSADLSDVNTGHYVLTGLCVHEGTWFALEKRLNRLKQRYCPPGSEFELHAAEFCVDIREQSEIPGFGDMDWQERRTKVIALQSAKIAAETTDKKKKGRQKKYRRSASFVHLTRRERTQLLQDALDLVGSHQSIILFAEAVAKSHPGVQSGQVDPVHQAFEQVVARFEAYLRRRHDANLKRSTRPSINKGMLILDQDYSTEEAIVRQFRDYRQKGHPWGSLDFVIDSPLFASSERVSGLKLVDACAYAVRRYLDTGAKPNSFEELDFQRIFHLFDRGAKLHGVRHYVPAGTCGCLICQARGHGAGPAISAP